MNKPKRVFLNWSIDQWCPGCNRKMHPKGTTSIDGSAPYGTYGFCVRCSRKRAKGIEDMSASYWNSSNPCKGCDRTMVSQRSGNAGAPTHVSKGYCDRCYRRSKKGISLAEPDRRIPENYVPQPCPSGCGRLIKPYGVPMHQRSCTGPNGAELTTSPVALYYLGTEVHEASHAYSTRPDSSQVYIYALVDPKSQIKYVGKTVKSLQARLYGHYADALRYGKTHKVARWLKSESDGVRIVLLGTYTRDLWEIWERYWIAKLLATGTELKNIELGGNQGKKIKDG